MEEATPIQIIEDIRKGSEKVFRYIYDQYYIRLENFATSYVVRREEAADIVQSVFLTLWDRKKLLSDETNLNNYLITLTRNQCLNHLKHKRAGQNYHTYTEQINNELLLNYYALEKLHDDKVIFKELEIMVQHAIDSMPEQTKESFILSRFEGMKYQEIALKLDISVKTVEKRMSSALNMLREALKDYLLLL